MSGKCWCGTDVCSICNPPKILTPEEQEKKIKHDLWKGQIDTERLDKLEEFIKNSRDGIAIQFDDSCTNQWMLFLLSWQCGADGWSGGIGLDDNVSRCNTDLRSAIDSLKKD